MSVDDQHRQKFRKLDEQVPERLLCGPGPANVDPAALKALSVPLIGHMDPAFIKLSDETQEMLRYAWQTSNKLTSLVTGAGSAAMEACIVNLLERGDKFLVFQNGYFGLRMQAMAEKQGIDVVLVKRAWGTAFTLDEIKAALAEHKPKMMGIVHAETSTGVLQPMEGVGKAAHDAGALIVLDTVTSLAGAELRLDAWEIDAAYSGAQKCFGASPGISMLSLSERAVQAMHARKTPVPSWYLDLSLLTKYWSGDAAKGGARSYHHTAPVSAVYQCHVALRAIVDEGLEERWARHQRIAKRLYNGLAKIGLEPLVAEAVRAPALTTVKVPADVDAKKVTAALLAKGIEIGGGLGELAGKAWRIGLMGYNARDEVVDRLLAALGEVIKSADVKK